MILIVLITFSNPGILPRNIDNTLYNKKYKQRIVTKGFMINYKICSTCLIMKPPRSNHCIDCDNCVLCFDHHCPWIGQCITRKNYKKFIWFLILSLVQLISISVLSILKLQNNIDNFKVTQYNPSAKVLSKNISSLFLIIYCLLIVLFITLLLSYHLYLIYNNMTTRESLKKINIIFGNSIFDRSYLGGKYYSKIGNIIRLLIF